METNVPNPAERGPESSAALRAHGIEPAWVPSQRTSHEIAQRLSEEVGPESVVSLQRHGEPVPELVDALLVAGALVIEIAPHTWAPAADHGAAVRLVGALLSGEAQALLVTSAPQALFLFVVANEGGAAEELRAALRQRVFTAAVGSVAGGGLGDQGVTVDLVGRLVRELAAARERVLEMAAGRPSRPGRASTSCGRITTTGRSWSRPVEGPDKLRIQGGRRDGGVDRHRPARRRRRSRHGRQPPRGWRVRGHRGGRAGQPRHPV